MNDSVNTLLERARLSLEAGKVELARELVADVLAAEPEHAGAFELLAEIAVAGGELDLALEHVERSIALDPQSCNAYQTLAFLRLQRDEYKKARAAIGVALRLHPDGAAHLAMAAEVETVLGHWSRALEFADAGLGVDPMHRECLNLRSLALQQLGRKDEAGATIKVALRGAPDDARTHWTKGVLSLHGGASKEALEHFREALRQDPNNEVARRGLLHALRSKNPVYRGLMAITFWFLRFSLRMRQVLVVGVLASWVAARQTLQHTGHDDAAKWLLRGVALTVLGSVFSIPLYDLVLMRHSLGCNALSDRERRMARTVAVLFGFGFVAMLVNVAWDSPVAKDASGLLFALGVPSIALVWMRPGWLRRSTAVLGLAALAVAVWWTVLAVNDASAREIAPLPIRQHLATVADDLHTVRMVTIVTIAMFGGLLLGLGVVLRRRAAD